MSAKRLVIDLDGVLCTIRKDDQTYRDVFPIVDNVRRLNAMVERGWHVTVHTARGMDTYGGDIGKIREMLGSLTVDWLQKNGVRYHVLKFGKPPADLYVDDRSAGYHLTEWTT